MAIGDIATIVLWSIQGAAISVNPTTDLPGAGPSRSGSMGRNDLLVVCQARAGPHPPDGEWRELFQS